MVTWGTLSTLDTLAANSALQTVAQIGEDRLWSGVDELFRAHNMMVAEQMAALVEPTTDEMSAYGGGGTMAMQELDQFGIPDVQKISVGSTVGFPLRRYANALGWTRQYFERTTVAEFSRQVRAIFDSDMLNLQTALRTALFRPTNYTFRDVLAKNIDLAVKALVNADSATIPPGPFGATFNAATHTHYLTAATLDETALDALIGAVLEHYAIGGVLVLINQAQEATVRDLDGFNPVLPVEVIPTQLAVRAVGNLDTTNLQSRRIGYYDNGSGAAWVETRPWIPANYLCAYNPAAPKPLAMRTEPGGGDLRLVADWEQYPLRARAYERIVGFGVKERTSAAILEITGGAYALPSGL